MISKKKKLSISQQLFAIRSIFPQFKIKRRKPDIVLVGYLQPTPKSPSYEIQVKYKYPLSPKVWILSPSIVPNAVHRYKDESLCLYYPADRSWDSNKFIAFTIIPWIAEWLYLYEIWLVTGKWYGNEAPHTDDKYP